MSRPYSSRSIRPEMTVRQVAVDFPASREVFLHHGEPERPPGQFGHLEPLAHFARRMGLALDELLLDLAAATGAPIEAPSRPAETIHHGYILSALAITLTLGAGWGGWLLWRIGITADFGAVPAADVIAHGEAQLWGFITLFIMGIALRTVLQAVARHRLGLWACRGLLLLALFGIVGGFIWFLLPAASVLGLAAATSLVLMSAGFLAMQLVLLHRKWTATWARAVMASGMWLVAWAIVTAVLRWSSGSVGAAIYSDSQRLLLIELAVFGFALNSIYGFGQMLLPGLLRIGSTHSWAIETSHWVHNAGTFLLCLATVLGWSGIISATGCALLTTGAVLFAVGIRGFIGRQRKSKRDEQGHAALDLFPPMAFAWLIVSLILMTSGFVYEQLARASLPHAYMGAVRHALTVGFMTTLILGVGQRLLPVLDRTVLAKPRLVVPILVLIGVGNLLRVGTEFATIGTPTAYSVMPVSALLEWAALLLFAINAIATMLHTDALFSIGQATLRSSLSVLLGEYPEIEDRLIAAGSQYLARTRSVPSELTIGSFAESEGWEPMDLIDQVNGWLSGGIHDTAQSGLYSRTVGRNASPNIATFRSVAD